MIWVFVSYVSGVFGVDFVFVGKKCSVIIFFLIMWVIWVESCIRIWELNNLYYYWDKFVVFSRCVYVWDMCWRGFLYVLYVFCMFVSDVFC